MRNRGGHGPGGRDEPGRDRGHHAAPFEAGAEDALGTLEPAAERAGVAAEFASGFFLRAALEEAEHDGIAEAIGQAGEFFVEHAELVGEVDGVIGFIPCL